MYYVCRIVGAKTTPSSLQVNLLNLRNLMHLILHLWGVDVMTFVWKKLASKSCPFFSYIFKFPKPAGVSCKIYIYI